MWTVTMTIHDAIDGIDITRDCVFKFNNSESALCMVEKMTTYMENCIGKYTITIGHEDCKEQPFDWKE